MTRVRTSTTYPLEIATVRASSAHSGAENVSHFGLDVKVVSYGQPSQMLRELAQEFG
jgi:hypothetical protein